MRQRLTAMFADPAYRTLARSILGTDDPAAIEARVSAFCAETLGAAPTGCTGIAMSIGVVLELSLEDGRAIALKIHREPAQSKPPPREGQGGGVLESQARLTASYQIMHALAAAGLPCPRLLLPPTPFGDALAVVMTHLPSPPELELEPATRRRFMARGLAEQIRRAAELDLPAELPGPRTFESPWPAPHNALFDFAATRAGAESIDAVGAATAEALATLDRGPLVVGHSDWSAHNIRCTAAGVAAIYDGDSFRRDAEAVFAGNTAITCCLDARTGFPFDPPTPDDAEHFLAEYEKARGQAFDPTARRIARLCAVRQLAYIARCQYALRVTQGDPEPWPFERALAVFRLQVVAQVLE